MFIDKWIEIKERLDGKYELNDETKEDWKDAVNIFSRRLQRYYITPINELKKGITGEGFPIVTRKLDHLCGNENDGSEWWSKS